MVKLEGMGFGLKQLSWLYNFLKEISEENGLSEANGYAVKIFIDQVERYYDHLLGFEKQADIFKEELQRLKIEYLAQVRVTSALPYVGSALAHLLNRGIKVDQIVKLAELSEMRPDMIQKLLQHCGSDDNNKEQQQHDGIKSVRSISSSSSPPPLSSPSSSSPSLNSPSSHSQHHSESPS